jgi:hypothetical protein
MMVCIFVNIERLEFVKRGVHSKCTVKELGILMSSQKVDSPVNRE